MFGDERPKPNLNRGAGLDGSPAVREYLSMADTDVTDWKFVDFSEVPERPWSTHGTNNTFVLTKRMKELQVVLAESIFLRVPRLQPPTRGQRDRIHKKRPFAAWRRNVTPSPARLVARQSDVIAITSDCPAPGGGDAVLDTARNRCFPALRRPHDATELNNAPPSP